jgi:hypothetical protein
MLLALEYLGSIGEEGAKALPQIFREAVKTPIGIFGLMIVWIGLLAWGFFAKAGSRVTMIIFFSLLAGVVIFAVAFIPILPPRAESNMPPPTPSPSSPLVNGSPLPSPTQPPRQEVVTSIKSSDPHAPKSGASNAQHRYESQKIVDVSADPPGSLSGIRTLFSLPGRLLWSFFDVLLVQRCKDALRPAIRPDDRQQRKDHRQYVPG